MKTIKLTQGQTTTVDDDIFEIVGHLNWFAQKARYTFYVGRNFHKSEGDASKRGMLMLHHVVIGFPINNRLVVDHIDGNGLNNLRSNLRITTHRENTAKMLRINRTQTSKYVGVRITEYNTWEANIQENRKHIYIGRFKTEREAHLAYQKKKSEIEHHLPSSITAGLFSNRL